MALFADQQTLTNPLAMYWGHAEVAGGTLASYNSNDVSNDGHACQIETDIKTDMCFTYTYNMYYVYALCYILSILENHDQPLIQGGFRHSGWMA